MMNCKKPLATFIPLLLLALSATAAHADDGSGRVTLGAGVDYSTGKYGTDFNTDIWDVPLSVGYEADRWSVKLTVPYINISGASNVIPGVGRVDNGNPHGRGHGRGNSGGGGGGTTPPPTVTSGSASGLGDVVAQATYGLVRNDDAKFGLDLTGKIKFGTANENEGLGTGKNDYGVNLDAYKGFGPWTAFGGVGWTKYGSSTFIPLHNGWNGNFGAGYKLSDSDSVGAYYYYRERISDAGFAQRELTGYWNHHFSDTLRLQAYALAGFSDGSPDWGLGASLKYAF
ncbi:MAG TPA: transporter [Rhodanobacteraceae bacterium]